SSSTPILYTYTLSLHDALPILTPITILGVLGNPSGMRTAQISLSHGFGDGGAQSCELTVEAVSNLLLGEKIDFYVAMNLDGISRSEEHTSELQSRFDLVCRLLL